MTIIRRKLCKVTYKIHVEGGPEPVEEVAYVGIHFLHGEQVALNTICKQLQIADRASCRIECLDIEVAVNITPPDGVLYCFDDIHHETYQDGDSSVNVKPDFAGIDVGWSSDALNNLKKAFDNPELQENLAKFRRQIFGKPQEDGNQ